MHKRMLVMAGGTGGHVFPGIAVAEYLRDAGWQIDWLGTKDRMEARIVPQHDINIHFIDVAGVRGNGLVRLLKAPFMVINAVLQAISILRRVKPNIVLGMGGYASGPGGVAAWLLGVPLVLHEQNATPGLTNKLLAPLARKILTGFDVSDWKVKASKIMHVGNPVRATFSEVSEKSQVNEQLRILVSGGSLGAKVLNEKVPESMAMLDHNHIQLWHQTGKGNRDAVQQAYESAGVKVANIKVAEFVKNMNEAYEWADVVICRAGALTVSEVALAGRCAIFVPLPTAVDDHQTQNARYLEAKEAAIIMPQREFNSETLTRIIQDLNDNREKIISMSNEARRLGVKSATQDVAKICSEEAS